MKIFKVLLIIFVMIFTITTLMGCSKDTYTVEFDLNYEDAAGHPLAQDVKDGEKATEPIEPSRDDYEFIGWYTDNSGTNVYDFNDSVTEDLTLYAKWEEVEEETVYYVAGNFSNYSPSDSDFTMSENEEGLYTITIELTEANRDTTYDGHYYKVTDGTWDVSYGVDNYYIDPAPVSPTGGGLGSIWHWGNGTLTITFDPESLTITDSLVMDSPIIEDIDPSIYGEFNSWATEGDNAFVLLDPDEDGIYTGMIDFTEAGQSDFTVAISKQWFDDQYGQRWGVSEQYKFDGTTAGMGDTTTISYDQGKYLFSYNSNNHETTYGLVSAGYIDEYVYPRLYGEFNGWDLDGENAFVLTDSDEDGIFTGTLEFTEVGQTDITLCISRQWFDDQYGQRWGANEQYKLDGTVAGMGGTSSFTYEIGIYEFSYDSNTDVTTFVKLGD